MAAFVHLRVLSPQLALFIDSSRCAGASPVDLVVKNPPANAGDVRDKGSIPGSGRSTGRGNGNPLQYSRLENPTDGVGSLAGYGPWGRTELYMTKATEFSHSASRLLLSQEPGFSVLAEPVEPALVQCVSSAATKMMNHMTKGISNRQIKLLEKKSYSIHTHDES